MLNFVYETIFWTLALYGLIEIIKNIYYVCTYTSLKPSGIYLIIAAKNQEDRIEGFLRSVLFRFLYGKEEFVKKIIVTDLNSDDETKEILQKINKDYDCIKYTEWKKCKEIIDNIEKTKLAE